MAEMHLFALCQTFLKLKIRASAITVPCESDLKVSFFFAQSFFNGVITFLRMLIICQEWYSTVFQMEEILEKCCFSQ